MACEMCGRAPATIRVSIEGSILSLCDACGKYGKAVGRIAFAQPKKAKEMTKTRPEEENEFVVANCGQLLKQKREQLGLKQEEFARKIAVKESVLHKMETNAMVPGIEEARRIEKALGLKLIEKIDVVENTILQPRNDQLTLGDMIKIKKKG